jgi:hypothetical protein
MSFSIRAALISVAFVLGSASSVAAGLSVEVVFSHDESTTIRAYFQSHDYQSAQGKKKNKGSKALPPGIAKNLARGKPLPPGIAKRSLPADLLAGLPHAPHGYERLIVDGKVLLVEVATQIVHDVLTDVFIK